MHKLPRPPSSTPPKVLLLLLGAALGFLGGLGVTSRARDSGGSGGGDRSLGARFGLPLGLTSATGSVSHPAAPLVIVTSHFEEDVAWLEAAKVPVVVCDKPSAEELPPSLQADVACSLPINLGKEASPYLAYIVTHYDQLPERVAFLHGHERALHQSHPDPLLRAIETAKPNLPFVSLNNQWHVIAQSTGDLPPGTPDTVDTYVDIMPMKILEELWPTHFAPYLPEHRHCPRYVRGDRGAQFVLTRAAIRQHPRKLYEDLLRFLIYPEPRSGWTNYRRAIAMEIIWPVLFGLGPDLCVGLPTCTHEAVLDAWFDRNATFVKVV